MTERFLGNHMSRCSLAPFAFDLLTFVRCARTFVQSKNEQGQGHDFNPRMIVSSIRRMDPPTRGHLWVVWLLEVTPVKVEARVLSQSPRHEGASTTEPHPDPVRTQPLHNFITRVG